MTIRTNAEASTPSTPNARATVAHSPQQWGLSLATLHQPLLWLALGMVLLSIVSIIGLVADPRITLGAPLWAKPLKFALSIALYSLTLAWLLGMLRRQSRIVWWLGTVSVIFLAVEIVVIVGAAASGGTSHFNVATPLSTALWSTMAISIVIVWVAAAVVALLLWRHQISDPARSRAIKAGVIIGLVGMGLAFLMTTPSAQQLADFQGVAGAHAVGVPDGGDGLPILGWSTTGGDLRIPHFVGMHALQVLPLTALMLELLAPKLSALRSGLVRLRIVSVVVALYAAITALLTVQALAGQSIVQPDVTIATVTLTLFVAAGVAVAMVLIRAGVTTKSSSQ